MRTFIRITVRMYTYPLILPLSIDPHTLDPPTLLGYVHQTC